MKARCFLTVLAAALPLLACAGGSASFSVGAARVQVPVQSMKERRDAGVVRQRFDYSCGSAALATLLTYGMGDPVDELSVLAGVLRSMKDDEVAQLQKRGLSLLDLARFSHERGYRAQAFRIPGAQLARITAPVLVYIRPQGYEHFAVLKGVRGERVYLADPAVGNTRMPLYEFLAMWADESGRGIVLAVEAPER